MSLKIEIKSCKMHNQVKELADKAAVTVITTRGLDHVVDGCYIVSPDKLQKFAEMIVQECLGICKSVEQIDGMAWECSDSIKQHFGVDA